MERRTFKVLFYRKITHSESDSKVSIIEAHNINQKTDKKHLI